jgi:hypothetical protein
MNHVGGQFEGAQFGGIINSAGKDALCAQFSGILNRAHGPFIGAQFGGVGNYVHQDVQGIQTSGVVNLTMGTLNGIQIAGVVNIARKVQKGIQIGVVNVSEENEGVPIGLVSYVKNVPMHFETWGDEMGFFHMGWRSGNRRVYNIVSISSKLQGDTFWWGFGSGLGVRYSMSKKWQFDCGFMSMQVRRFARCGSETDEVNTLKMVAIYRIANRFSIFGGPTLNVLCTRNERTSTLVPWSFHEGRWKERRIHMWPGFVFGVRI